MALTLNQVVKNLNYIGQAHNQVKTFFFGELYDFASSGTTQYPAMAVTLQPSQRAVNTLTYSFNVYMLDLVHKDISNNTEVLSDTLQMCLDVLAIVDNPVYDWTLEKTAVLTDIQGGQDDEVTGHWFNLKLKVPTPRDRCQVPTIGDITVIVPIPETSDGLTDDDGNLLQTEDGFYLIND